MQRRTLAMLGETEEGKRMTLLEKTAVLGLLALPAAAVVLGVALGPAPTARPAVGEAGHIIGEGPVIGCISPKLQSANSFPESGCAYISRIGTFVVREVDVQRNLVRACWQPTDWCNWIDGSRTERGKDTKGRLP
jgi:hypothetical protein